MVSLRMFVKQFFIIIVILYKHTIIADGFGINLIKVPDDDESQVVCPMAFLRKYFKSGESLSGSVLYISLTSASMHTQRNLLESIHDATDVPWSVVIRDAKNTKSNILSTTVLHEKPQAYFVIIENLEDEDLDDIFEDWKITVNWNPLAQFVVYLCSVEETDEEMTELMIEILLSFMNKKIYNVNVIGQNEETGYYYGKTVFPYHPDNNCGNRVISIETLDICDYHVGERPENDDNDNYDDDDENEDEDVRSGSWENNDSADIGEQGNSDNAGNEDEVGKEMTNGDTNENSNNANDADNSDSTNDENLDDSGYGSSDVDNNHDSDTTNNDNDEKSINGKGADDDETNDYDSTKDSGDVPEINKSDDNGYNSDRNNDNESDMTHGDDKDDEDGSSEDRNGSDSSSNENYMEISKIDGIQNTERKDKFFNEIKRKERSEAITQTVFESGELEFRMKRVSTKQEPVPVKNNKPVYSISPKLSRLTAFRKKRNVIQKSLHLESEPFPHESYTNTTHQTPTKPTFYFEEVLRALFLDKFPKDLSGCPQVASYRPWEPYIFAESHPEVTGINKTESVSFQSENDYESETTWSEGNIYDIKPNTFGDYDSETTISNEDTTEKVLNGIEYKLLQTIGERLHIRIDLQIENRNLYHLFQQLIDGEIEMIVGGIDEDPSMSQYVSSTVPYHQDDLTFCVRRARRSHNIFNFLASFSLVVWLVTFIYMVTVSTTIIWMQRKLKVRLKHLNGYFSVLFRIFGIIFSQWMPLKIADWPLRLVFFTAFLMALIFSNAYQSFLISTLTTPKSTYQISRVEEIYQNQMIIKGSVENVRHLNKEGEIFRYIRENFQMCYNIEECLIEAAENEQIAVAVSRQHSFYNPRIPRNRLYCFNRNENIYVYLVTMLLPKKFHLLHKINPVIQYVIESGHMQKWARDLDMRRRIREERSHAHDHKIRSLTLDQVFGSFVLTGALLSIALLAFILEYCVYRLATKRRRTRLKVVKYLHRKFQRYPIKHY